jgi:hypothetical protein
MLVNNNTSFLSEEDEISRDSEAMEVVGSSCRPPTSSELSRCTFVLAYKQSKAPSRSKLGEGNVGLNVPRVLAEAVLHNGESPLTN